MARYAERAPESTAADRFATVLLAEIPDDEPVVRLLSCGHPAPVVQRGPAVRTVELSSPSVPIHLPVPVDAPFTVDEVPFAPGDRMLMFTDGVSETRDGHGAFYPLEQRLRGWAAEPADRIPGLLKEDLARYGAHGLDDDTTAVLVVRGGAGRDPAVAGGAPDQRLRGPDRRLRTRPGTGPTKPRRVGPHGHRAPEERAMDLLPFTAEHAATVAGWPASPEEVLLWCGRRESP